MQFLRGPARLLPDLFEAHPPFQIDGNFGGASIHSFNGNPARLRYDAATKLVMIKPGETFQCVGTCTWRGGGGFAVHAAP